MSYDLLRIISASLYPLLHHFPTNWTQGCHQEPPAFPASAFSTTRVVATMEVAINLFAIIRGVLPTHHNSVMPIQIESTVGSKQAAHQQTVGDGQRQNYEHGKWHLCLQVRNIELYGYVPVLVYYQCPSCFADRLPLISQIVFANLSSLYSETLIKDRPNMATFR